MSRWLLFFLCCAVSSGTVGQEFISLRAVPFKASTKESIYIESVLDERNIKTWANTRTSTGMALFWPYGQVWKRALPIFTGFPFQKKARAAQLLSKSET